MVCLRRAVGSVDDGDGTVVDGRVSNLIVTLVAEASAAF